jgi:NAD(P)-dependent dehydrogenase (short-subunit alcohol dehydrogenase family)
MTHIALITGAGSGIGRACALTLAEAGWTVALAGRTASSLEATRTAAGAKADQLVPMPTDVTDPEQVDALFARISADLGHLDVVFNNAGTNVPPSTIDQISISDWQHVIDVNLHGAFLVARGAFATMRAQDPQGGRIINNGSISAQVPRPGSVPYTVSKHAITGLTRTLSLDGRPFNIACCQIDIGNTASDMTEQMSKGVPQADGSTKPEPVMDVAHVANAVFNMASLPLSANVQFMTIMATAMPLIGRG